MTATWKEKLQQVHARPYMIWPKSSHFIILLTPVQPHSSWLPKWTPSSWSVLSNMPSSSSPPLWSLTWCWRHGNTFSDVTSSTGLPSLTSLSKPAPPSPPELGFYIALFIFWPFLKSFIEIEITYHTTDPSKVYKSMLFSVFTAA